MEKTQKLTQVDQPQKQIRQTLQGSVEKTQQSTQVVHQQEQISSALGKGGIVLNPYQIDNKTGKQIDYENVMTKFGCYGISNDILSRMQSLTKKPVHRFLKRGIFYAHRDLQMILDAYQNHKNPDVPPFYLYTGRGPSSEALHLGHMLPFIFNKYLQQSFDVPFVIQVTDDQKFFHHDGGSLQDFTNLAIENIKDILALGFDPEKTFIFIDSKYMGTLYPSVCKFQKHINLNTLKAIFGMDMSANCGIAAYPAIQAAPCLSSAFPHIFGDKNIPCLIPCGIDQDPYFRMTRDVCAKIKAPKPAGLYSKFFPSLQGFSTKMSASNPNSGIFLTDSPKQIQAKIKSALSGGKTTKQQQQKYGADLSIDIPFNYLRFFLDDDEQLQEIRQKYSTGKMLTGQVKKILIKVIQDFVKNHQQRRAKITNEEVMRFLSTHQRKFSYNVKDD